MTSKIQWLLLVYIIIFQTNVYSNTEIFYGNVRENLEMLEAIQEHLIPNNHPAKKILDSIFSQSRAIYNMDTMVEAGFDFAIPQHHTQVIVTRHHQLQGYVIKAYLDEQSNHNGQPEEYFWIKRANGAKLVRKLIRELNYGHLFKAPRKWIYHIPNHNISEKKYVRRFILIEEDMDLLDMEENIKTWKSNQVTKEFLSALFTILTKLGLWDCSKPSNCAFSSDGRAAFIDTQTHSKKCVKYHSLFPYLTPKMRIYWQSLIDSEESIPCRRRIPSPFGGNIKVT